jgi:hypothetical protein
MFLHHNQHTFNALQIYPPRTTDAKQSGTLINTN